MFAEVAILRWRTLLPITIGSLPGNFPTQNTLNHAEQVHGKEIAVISEQSGEALVVHPKVDGLITNIPGQTLAIYVADCAAIYLVDPVTRSARIASLRKKRH